MTNGKTRNLRINFAVPRILEPRRLVSGSIIGFWILSFGFPAFALKPVVPSHLLLRVSGNPVPRDFLIDTAVSEIERSLVLDKETSFEVEADKIAAPEYLAESLSTLLAVPVKVIPPEGKSLLKWVSVEIINEPLEEKADDYLIVSNNPEIIPQAGVLFTSEIKSGDSARFLYFHRVKAQDSFDLTTSLKNSSPVTAEVFLIRAIGGPDSDGIFAGHMATMRFLDAMRYRSGQIIEVPPKNEVPLSSQRLLKRKEIASGIFRVRLLKGEALTLKVEARKGTAEALPFITSAAGDRRSADHFPSPEIYLEKSYQVSKGSLEIRLGEKPAKKSLDGNILIGNYGALHRIQLKLINDLPEVKSVKLSYGAAGGLTRGVFVVEGQIYETGLLGSKVKEEEVLSLELPPRTTKNLILLTMPQPGVYYPTNLILRTCASKLSKGK